MDQLEIKMVKETGTSINIKKHLKDYMDFIGWARACPDLFLDLIKPAKGSINLHADQRVFMRAIMRFYSVYGVFNRGYGKTFCEVLCMILVAILYPRIHIALTAQTKENAASILKEKYLEIIKFYPLLENEVVSAKFSKNSAEIEFANGSVIDILANAQSSKGQRRARISAEEAAQIKAELFEDVIEPIVEVPRVLPNGIADPRELNQNIAYFTTSGYRNSVAYDRALKTHMDMLDLDGKISIGSSWMLGSYYGRGSNKDQIIKKREDLNPVAFAQNYMSHWVGNSSGALVDIQKLMDCRTLNYPEFENEPGFDYVLGIDVARSLKSGNAISSVAVIKIIRDDDLKIKQLHLVNIFEISGNKNFEEQAVIIKKIKNAFEAKAVCLDNNGLGVGILDELLKQTYDPETGKRLGCWQTINADVTPEEPDAERCIYALMPQSDNSNIIVNFIGMVEAKKLRLLIKKNNEDYSLDSMDNQSEEVLPYVLTDLLIDEVANLKLKTLPSNKLSVERVISSMNKDNYSALAYGLWYAKTYEDAEYVKDDLDDILGAVIF